MAAGATVLALAGAAGVYLVTLENDGAPPTAAPPPTPEPEPPPAAEPIRFEPEPLWTTSEVMADVYDVWLRDDAVIMSGTDKSGTAQLIVSDVETGERRWSLPDGLADLSGGRGASWWGYDAIVVGDGADWSVLVTYIADDADRTSEFGLAALSGEDGHVLWMTPAIPAVPFESEAAEANESLDVALTAASDQLAVVTVAPSDAIKGLRRVRPDTVRAVAIDATTGRQRWKRTG